MSGRDDRDAPTVVVLHGLARTHHSMRSMVTALERGGFRTWSKSYPSRTADVESLAKLLAERIAKECSGELMAVTHSLGGIVWRHMAHLLPWRRAVLVAPPNRGSLVAKTLRDRAAFRWIYGPAGFELGEGERWPLPTTPFAVIAGSRSLALSNPTSWLTRGARLFDPDDPSDGTVLVRETVLPSMTAFATVDECHTRIMNHPDTQRLALSFLRAETFDSDSSR